MIEVNDRITIPDEELEWSFVRSGGPGGQNVNKVASKAVLRWHLSANQSVPDEVKVRLRTLQRSRITVEGDLVLTSQRWRDQPRNREDCLEKLREMILQATFVPRSRRPTKATRGSRERRLAAKRHRSAAKEGRRQVGED